MTTSLNVTNKLPAGIVEVYNRLHCIAVKLDIPVLIVGATARDIILVHGYGAAIERGTRDVDFGLEVESWAHYQALREALIQTGFTVHPHKTHQLNTQDGDGMPWEIDLIPFGSVSDSTGQITWPPEHDFAMTVLGFAEVYTNAWNVTLSDNPQLCVKVASPAGILLLKLIAWTERGRELQGKDATDIYYVIRHYARIPHVVHSLHDDGYMEAQGYDDIKACTMKLADEVLAMAHPLTLKHLHAQLLDDGSTLDRLAADIAKYSRAGYEEAEALVDIIRKRLYQDKN
ncbi:nucleotidyl transferase AbiEii/AbiGii toxin family protein [Arsukibacterium perlucidum]|uniref:nucleotidyl transferase AbiEii/AbiGii toxin family protein n=1 Tax=Arsukibacterium perlucidum TaxID=368811 RepID=UPI00039C2DF9|nr:nucleotidyl transferase AbiEii/AbiGii toxin family protein [Arsukibacterium perlucidum]